MNWISFVCLIMAWAALNIWAINDNVLGVVFGCIGFFMIGWWWRT